MSDPIINVLTFENETIYIHRSVWHNNWTVPAGIQDTLPAIYNNRGVKLCTAEQHYTLRRAFLRSGFTIQRVDMITFRLLPFMERFWKELIIAMQINSEEDYLIPYLVDGSRFVVYGTLGTKDIPVLDGVVRNSSSELPDFNTYTDVDIFIKKNNIAVEPVDIISFQIGYDDELLLREQTKSPFVEKKILIRDKPMILSLRSDNCILIPVGYPKGYCPVVGSALLTPDTFQSILFLSCGHVFSATTEAFVEIIYSSLNETEYAKTLCLLHALPPNNKHCFCPIDTCQQFVQWIVLPSMFMHFVEDDKLSLDDKFSALNRLPMWSCEDVHNTTLSSEIVQFVYQDKNSNKNQNFYISMLKLDIDSVETWLEWAIQENCNFLVKELLFSKNFCNPPPHDHTSIIAWTTSFRHIVEWAASSVDNSMTLLERFCMSNNDSWLFWPIDEYGTTVIQFAMHHRYYYFVSSCWYLLSKYSNSSFKQTYLNNVIMSQYDEPAEKSCIEPKLHQH